MQTLESHTADVILQRPKKITIGGKEYLMAQPTLATLVLVSETVAALPEATLTEENVVVDVLREARHLKGIAEVAAIMLLGEKNLTTTERRKVVKPGKKHLWGLWCEADTEVEEEVVIDHKAELAKELMQCDMRDLSAAIGVMIRCMNTEDFFVIASFLASINLTKATRKEAKTTASGR